MIGRYLLPAIRILVADDYEDWRKRIHSLLQARSELQVICEVSDGLEAVQKAEELQPDIILLDIGLPRLNGIEAARRIRRCSPNSRIIFVSLDSSADTVQVALSTGAQGFVYKGRVRSELLPAIAAALSGKQFVTGLGTDYRFIDSPGKQASHRHEVQFYSDDAVLLESFARFITAALKASNPAIVVATKSHRDSLLQKLRTEYVEIDAAIQRGTYISLDAADALSSMMVNGLLDATRYVSGLIKAASKTAEADYPRIALCGEGTGLLWTDGQTDAAIQLEQLCDDLCKSHEVDILCAYPLSAIRAEEGVQALRRICAAHSAVYSR